MANEFYITAGLRAQDKEGSPAANAFYMTAGLTADDYTTPAGGISIPVVMHHLKQQGVS